MANEKRLIDANEVIKETESILNFRRQHHMPTAEYEALLGYLKKRPTVDAVEVVRCKDCTYFRVESDDFLGICKCGAIATNYGGEIYPEREHFCSYGERREGECLTSSFVNGVTRGHVTDVGDT